MVSIWWVALAFVLGGLAGLLIFALLSMSATQEGRAVKVDEDLQRRTVGKIRLEEEWTT
jgi:RsiW-degrading membrane proteinase PrsW (M82 family)